MEESGRRSGDGGGLRWNRRRRRRMRGRGRRRSTTITSQLRKVCCIHSNEGDSVGVGEEQADISIHITSQCNS